MLLYYPVLSPWRLWVKVLLSYHFGKDNIGVDIVLSNICVWLKQILFVSVFSSIWSFLSKPSFMFHLNFSCILFDLWIILLGKLQLSSACKRILKFRCGKQMDLTIFLSSFVNLSKFFLCLQENILYLVKYMVLQFIGFVSVHVYTLYSHENRIVPSVPLARQPA